MDKTCVLCGKSFSGYGNNPEPLKSEGECCDKCNAEKVIPARLAQMFGGKNGLHRKENQNH